MSAAAGGLAGLRPVRAATAPVAEGDPAGTDQPHVVLVVAVPGVNAERLCRPQRKGLLAECRTRHGATLVLESIRRSDRVHAGL